ncbi:MAG: hypothetical protein ACRDUA_18510, partial [Micromonosporaceae bacterium]
GITIPKPNPGEVTILGENADGTTIAQLDTTELCRLSSTGQLDTTYGTNGFTDPVEGFNHRLDPGSNGTGATCLLDTDGQVIAVVKSGHFPDASTGHVLIALRRITTTGKIDPNFGIGPPNINPPPSTRRIKLFAPHSSAGSPPDYANIRIAGMTWLRDTLYIIATGFAGGGTYTLGNGLTIRKPEYPTLLITRWTRQGEVDPTIPGGYQEGGTDPFLYWYANGVLRDAKESFLIYGGGGTPWTKTTQLPDGTTYTETLVRQPGPAIFRVNHPTGLDQTFGDHGAAVIRVPDLYPSVIAGGLSTARDHCTLAYLDPHQYQRGPLRSTFGGAARFR